MSGARGAASTGSAQAALPLSLPLALPLRRHQRPVGWRERREFRGPLRRGSHRD